MNNTLTNGLQLMRTLAESGEPQTVKDLSELLSWPKSHVCRLLKTLVESGYIEQDERRRYVVSLKVLTLSNAILRKMDLRRKLRPFIEKLAKDSGHGVHLAVPNNWRPVIVDVAHSAKSEWEDQGSTIGSENVLHASAAGKLCAAYHPEEGLEEFLNSISLVKYADRTIDRLDTFKVELEKVRRDRVAVSDGEKGGNIMAIGAPVFNADSTLAATIGMHMEGPLPQEEISRLKTLAAETAEAASYALGFPNWRNR